MNFICFCVECNEASLLRFASLVLSPCYCYEDLLLSLSFSSSFSHLILYPSFRLPAVFILHKTILFLPDERECFFSFPSDLLVFNHDVLLTDKNQSSLTVHLTSSFHN